MKYFTPLLFFCTSLLIQAQYHLSIDVDDLIHFSRINQANLLIENEKGDFVLYKSDENGQVYIPNISGEIKITCIKEGYKLVKTHFNMVEDLEVKFYLSPSIPEPLDFSDEYLIEGKVRDVHTGKEIADAQFNIGGKEIMSDKSGMVRVPSEFFDELDVKENDSIQYTVSAPNYETKTGFYHYAPLKLSAEYELDPLQAHEMNKSASTPIVDEMQILHFRNLRDQFIIQHTFDGNCSPLPTSVRLGINCQCNSCSRVVVLDIEDYVQTGLNDEWIASWHMESLKAGSIPYRTYGAYWVVNGSGNYDLASTPCKQNWISDRHPRTVSAAQATAGEYLVKSTGAIAFSEYSAENNNSGCGNGWAGNGTRCISDSVCRGTTSAGHGRGMCQWGTSRWANRGENYQWMVDHYYTPYGYSLCGGAAAPGTPEIVIESMSVSSASPRAGEPVNLLVQVKNLGTADAAPINVKYKINGNEVGTDTHPSLAPNQAVDESLDNYIFPSAGQYRYCVYVDGVPNEINTNNNSYCINVNVTEPLRPDIAVQRVWVAPNQFEEQEDVDLMVELKNVGNAVGNNINLNFKINNNSVGTQNQSSLAPNETVIKKIENYQFANAGAFNYCVSTNTVNEEVNTANNNLCTNVVALPATRPDLIVEDLWTELEEPEVGETVKLFVKIKNIGDRAAPSVSFDYKMNNTVVASDSYGELGINQSFTKMYDNYVFDAAGNFNYCVEVAPAVREDVLNNNSRCEELEVFPREDISITETEIDPEGVIMAGNEIQVSSVQRYEGRRYEDEMEDYKLSYYLSRDCTLSGDDILLGFDQSSIGRGHNQMTEYEALNLYNTLIPGTYYILFIADSDNYLEEYDEENNIACMEIEIDNAFLNGDDLQTRMYIYPNPTRDILHIMTNTDINIVRVEVYDTSGRLVRYIEGNQIDGIDLSTLMTGTYLLKFFNEADDSSFYRVLKH